MNSFNKNKISHTPLVFYIISIIIFLFSFCFGQKLSFRIYDVKEGLPQSQVNSIVQDSRGYLWFSTRGGLGRFDGKMFKYYGVREGLAENAISCSFVDNDGNLLFGHNLGGISKFNKNTESFEQINIPDTIASTYINQIFRDQSGNLWFATEGEGVLKFNGVQWQRISKDNGLSSNIVRSTCQQNSNSIWLGTDKGITIIDVSENMRFKYLTTDQGLIANHVTSLLKDSKGNIWIGTESSGVSKFSLDGKIRNITEKEGLGDDHILTIIEDSEGAIWFGTTENGVTKYISDESLKKNNKFEIINQSNGLKHNRVNVILEDREGSYWFACYTGGVCQYRGRQFEFYSQEQGLIDNMVWCIAEDKRGNYWFGSVKGLTKFTPDLFNPSLYKIKNYTREDGLCNDEISAIYIDQSGYIWLGIYEFGVCRFNPQTEEFQNIPGLEKKEILMIAPDEKGNLWFASNISGAYRLNLKTGKIRNFTIEDGLPSNALYAALLEKNGYLWFATEGAGLSRFNGQTFTNFGSREGILSPSITSLTEDRMGNIWIGTTNHGFYKYNGKSFESFMSPEVYTSDDIASVICDDNNILWIGTQKGINRFNPRTGDIKHFSRLEGFDPIETNQNAILKDSKGYIWFGTIEGVARCNPHKDWNNSIAPLIHIHDLRIFLRNADIPADRKFTFDRNHLTFDFTGLSFVSPEKITYQFKMEKFDKEWSPETPESYATYANLPPGEYIFRVKAKNSDGIWSEEAASYEFEILSPFWQTSWFYVLVLLSIGSIVYGAHWRRVKQFHKDNILLETKVQDRTRELLSAKEKVQVAFKAMLDSEDKLRKLTASVNAFLWSLNINKDGSIKYTLVTDSVSQITGYTADEFIDQGSHLRSKIIYSEDKEHVDSMFKKLLLGESGAVSFRIKRKDGGIRWVYDDAIPINDDNDLVTHVHGVCFDITDRKAAEEALRKSEEKYKTFVTYSSEAVWCVESRKPIPINLSVDKQIDWFYKHGFLSECNDAMAQMYGFSSIAEIIGLPLEKMLIKSEPKNIEYLRNFIKSGYRLVDAESYEEDKSGNKHIFLNSFVGTVEDNKLLRAWGIQRDITNQKKAQKALRESEERYRRLVELSPEAIIVHCEGKFVYTNYAAIKLFGARQARQLIGKELIDFAHPDYHKMIRKRLIQLYEKKKEVDLVEQMFFKLDGTEIFVEVVGVPITYLGKPAGQSVFRDITQRKQAEQDLIQEKEHLDVTLSSIRDAVITTDINGDIILMNRIAKELTGWKHEECIGQYFPDIVKIYQSGQKLNPIDQVFESGNVFSLTEDLILESRDKGNHMIEISCAPIQSQEKMIIGVVVAIRDITGRKMMEEELRKGQKLESLGILAGGIAHDFNNTLTAILGNISLAKLYSSDKKIESLLGEAEKATMQARDLTQQLLTFSKGGAPIKETTSVLEIVRESASFVLRGSNVQCKYKNPVDLWKVEVDAGQINQVIHNLIINAEQAMPEGGIVNITFENYTLRKSKSLPLSSGKYVKISIEDEGIGITPEHLPKIFDPYFTTKQKGSGLGLTTTYSVIKRHEGHIDIKSNIGKGTTVEIYLPASTRQIKGQKETYKSYEKGQGRVLVMDDEGMIRTIVKEMIIHLGYEVELVEDGKQAIEVFTNYKNNGQPFNAVILDLTIPGGMGGMETIKALKMIDPNVAAVVSSGYSNDPVMAYHKKYGFAAILTKPYRLEEISSVLGKLLEKQKKVAN